MKEAFWIIDQLIQQGITQFGIAPGSRNTPLVIASVEHPAAKTIVHYDERGIGFYALGVGKGSKRPAVVITTSGTAVGNLFPSVMEAHHSETPLILLTADRPIELRECGANQTTDQTKIFSHFVRWQIDLPPHLPEHVLRSVATQATNFAMQNPQGPVQINCQFREPLYVPTPPSLLSKSSLSFSLPRLLPPHQVHTHAKRGVILIGEIGIDPRSILRLASRLRWPVFADLLSNARLYSTCEQIRYFDWILKTNHYPSPDYILHFGKRFVSKSILTWAPTLHVSPSPLLQDPCRHLSSRLQCDIELFCEIFEADESDPSWLSLWKQHDEEMHSFWEKKFQDSLPSTEAHAMRKLSEILPENAALFLANGMPIRDADHFLFPKNCLGFFGNRGLSGIDGNIATSVGLSEGIDAPVIAFLGDQTCLHDLNSFSLLKKTRHPVTVIASNNFGSGIFSHLPIAEWPLFETYMAAAHSWRFEDVAKMFHIPYLPLTSEAFQQSSLIEFTTDRKENHRFQKVALPEMTCAVQEILPRK